MDLTLSLYVTIFVSLISQASTGCWIEDFDEDCNYTIVCAVRADAVRLPTCRAHRATLLVRDSILHTFSMKFYQPTDFAEIITDIKAVNNTWTNIAPFAFNFYHCTRMDLSNNNIKTISNNAFRTSYFLRELNLSRNAIEKLNPDSFNVSDYSWTNPMKMLDLSFNKLTEITVGALSTFPELKTLYLHGNKLSYLRDEVFTNLLNLKVLTLRYNELTTLNVTLVGLRNLKELDLSFNRLKHLRQDELVHAKSLEKIIMSNNNIETLDLKAFKYAKNLQTIDLSNNKIKSILLPFYNNAKLRYLNFSNNSISAVDYAPSYNRNTLEVLDYSVNNISVLNPQMIKNTDNLKVLNLSSNVLTDLGEGSLSNLKNIAVLDLSHNKLIKLDVKQFNHKVNLNTLILDCNSLVDIDFNKLLMTLSKLKVISVGGNNIPCDRILEFYRKGLELNVIVTSNDKIYNRTNVFGIMCNKVASINLVGRQNFKIEFLTWISLMILLVLILLISIIWSCIHHGCEENKRELIRLGIVEEQQTSLM